MEGSRKATMLDGPGGIANDEEIRKCTANSIHGELGPRVGSLGLSGRLGAVAKVFLQLALEPASFAADLVRFRFT